MADKTFIRITNQDIYNQLEGFIEQNKLEHRAIMIKQIQTNGKVKLNRWVATTAISLVVIVIGFVINLSL